MNRTQPSSKPARRRIFSGWLIATLSLGLPLFAAAIYILYSPAHSGQQKPQLEGLFSTAELRPNASHAAQAHTADSGSTPQVLLSQLDVAHECRPAASQWRVRSQAIKENRQVWLLVHEGDAPAMSRALTAAARQTGGHAARTDSQGWSHSDNIPVVAMAPADWLEQTEYTMRPYIAQPDRDTDAVTENYAAWAQEISRRQRQGINPPDPCPTADQLRPALLTVTEKPVGQLRDETVRILGALMALVGAVTVAAGVSHHIFADAKPPE